MANRLVVLEGRLLPFVVAFVCPGTIAAGGPRPVQPEDVAGLERITDPRISPDGGWVAFQRSRFDKEKRWTTAVWFVSADGARTWPIAANAAESRAPRWSPDGGTVAYLGRVRPEEPVRLYLYRLAERRTVRVVAGTEGAVDAIWSPDGTRVALVRRDPEPEAPRGHDAIVVGEHHRHRRLWLVDVAKGRVRPLQRRSGSVWHAAWSPDGWRLAVLVSDTADAEGLEYGSRLEVWNARTGAADVLLHETNAQATPSFSPDGSSIALLAPVGDFKERGIIHIVPSRGGPAREVLPHDRGTVWDVVWHPRRKSLVAGIARGTSHVLVAVPESGPPADLLTLSHSFTPYWSPVFSLSGDGETVAFIGETEAGPGQICVAELGGAAPRQLTRFHGGLAGVALGEVRAVHWTNPRDRADVEGVLVLPPGHAASQRHPLIVILHGGPAYGWGIGWQMRSWAQLFATRGFAVLLPNFRGSAGYGMAWMTANVRNFGHGPMGDVLAGVDAMVARGIADSERLFLGGGSYGGYLTLYTLAHTRRFRAAWVRAGMADLALGYALTDEPSYSLGYFGRAPYDDPGIYRSSSPITHARDIVTPLLMVHGENDARVESAQSRLLHSALRHFGRSCELVIYPREGHGIREYHHQVDVLQRVLAWIERHDRQSR